MTVCHECRSEITDAGPTYRCDACAASATARARTREAAALDHHSPPLFHWARRDAPELAQRVRPRSAIALAFEPTTALSIVFVGPAGSGKTSLARALWFELSMQNVPPVTRDWPSGTYAQGSRPPAPCAFVTAFDLAKARREHRLGQGEATLIDQAVRAPVTLIDEVGAEGVTNDSAVQEVVHARHSNKRLTVYTTGFRLPELEARYGAGCARRIFEDAKLIALGGHDGSAGR